MIPAPFEYLRASSIDDALAKLGASNGAGKLIAGGHSLVPVMKMRLAQPPVLVDITRIPGLAGIRQQGDRIEIGACTVHHDVANSPIVKEHAPAMADAAGEIGDPQVRNRGTVGGSLAHADPAADYPAVMLALDASIHVRGPRGTREIKANQFFKDLMTVDLAPDEILVAVSFAPARASAYAKLHQRASHFAIVGVAAALVGGNGRIESARVGLTGAGPYAVRLGSVERALGQQPASEESVIAAAGHAAADLTEVNADLHASADYRRAMVSVFTRRALQNALRRM
jgi:carbon-monoxide dehydrogenase medium subunit